GLLKYFTVTFDQEHSHVTFHRPSKEPIPPKTQRSSGMSFDKTPAYWRIASVIPTSPAAAAGVQGGDLVTRINDEPVANWDLARYQQLIASADGVEFTFLNGTQETVRYLKIFDLIP
ncbi:MAG TPA: PDZ domain-containing protein, partial [Opitutus sp.]|nr:PDZ domain-containing protein [Opitutus sp.]